MKFFLAARLHNQITRMVLLIAGLSGIGSAAGGHLLCCRSSTMTPHRLRRGASHLPARRSRQNANVIY
jgi:hypothetical protein